MPNFSYSYQGQTHNASAEHFLEGGHHRYLITLDNGSEFALAPIGIPSKNGIIWGQSNKPGEVIYAHELVQALGEGLEAGKLHQSVKSCR